jgi:twitching motility protein PilI
MANKAALRELQGRLAERLQAARTQQRGKSWLAVECSTRGFLFPLGEAGEIFPLAPVQPVPHTHRWFLGVSNLRGHLNGVVDLAAFLGVKSSEAARDQARLVGFNQQLGINCTMLVDKLAGLRSEADARARRCRAAPGLRRPALPRRRRAQLARTEPGRTGGRRRIPADHGMSRQPPIDCVDIARPSKTSRGTP